jgi:predicted nucleic-acid-binding Zn-ribbon protein
MRCTDCGSPLEAMEGAVSAADFECPKCRPECFEDVKISAAKRAFLALTEEQRIKVIDDFCRWCGTELAKTQSGVCHCENDE